MPEETPVRRSCSTWASASGVDQSAARPQAWRGPGGLLATHLAVLRDLHLLPLRHLGDVEVALWDPQQKRDTRKHQKKIKATENKKHSLKFVFVIISEFKRRHYIPNSVRYGVHMA